jgi:hypothetical protein
MPDPRRSFVLEAVAVRVRTALVASAVLVLVACTPAEDGTRSAGVSSPPVQVPVAANRPPPSPAPAAAPSPAPAAAPNPAPAAEPGPAEDLPGARLVTGPIPLPPDLLAGSAQYRARSVTEYGAFPDDGIDDTAAFRRALDDLRIVDGEPVGESPEDYNGRQKVLLVPAGRFDLSGTIGWTGCCVTVRGAGSGATELVLRDGADGFGDVDQPRPLLRTEATNEAFRNSVLHLAVDTGARNPGAVGVDFIASNHGVLRDVEVRSGDGSGVAGVDMTRRFAGPAMLQDVLVRGFDTGIAVGEPYQMTLERITLSGQRHAGVTCSASTLAIRGLLSDNDVPVWRPAAAGGENLCSLTLVGSELRGGRPGTAALDVQPDNTVYLRDVRAAGYDTVLRLGDDATGPAVDEYVTRGASADGGPLESLRLPVAEVPVPEEDDPATWSRAFAPEYNNSSRIAPAFDTDASTVYFTSEVYLVFDQVEVTVPDGVRRVAGYGSTINGDPRGRDGGGLRLVVGDGAEPLVVEGFGYGVTIDHRGDRPVVLRDGKYGYTSPPDARGDLFFENVEVHGFTLRAGQRLWARQWNNEHAGAKIVNEGGDLWVFGMKTEGPSTVLHQLGGRSELLGLLLYPAQPFPAGTAAQRPAYVVEGGEFSAVYGTNVFLDGRRDEYQVHLRTPSRDLTAADVPRTYERVGLVRR